MRAILSADAEEEVERHARRAYPEECCGVLVGRAEGGILRIVEAHPVRNAARRNAGRRFEVPAADFLRIERETSAKPGLAVVGLYHSHPDREAVASGSDAETASPGWIYLIAAVGERGVRDFRAWRFARPGSRADEIRISMHA